MNQPSPHSRSVNDFMVWAYNNNIAPSQPDYVLGASNYRVLGPRPSVIDTLMHSAFQVAMERYFKVSLPFHYATQ